MTEYCPTARKATITVYQDDGKLIKIISKKPPIQVNCFAGGLPEGVSCRGNYITIAGDIEYFYTVRANQESRCHAEGKVGDVYTLAYRQHPNSVRRENDYFSVVSIVCNGINTGIEFGGGYYHARIVDVANENVREPTLTISDSTGLIYRKKNQCRFDVACDDSCPPGFLKCFTTKYPGYCCISCNELKAQIIATKIAARMKNQSPVSR